MNKKELSKKIEAVLFVKGEPVDRGALARLLSVNEPELKEALDELRAAFAERGVRIVENGSMVSLRTAPKVSDIVERIMKEETDKELTKAALETLSIVLYQGPIDRSQIDFIRGVNSSFILRNLMVRGLVERTVDPVDRRTFLYNPSIDLLSHMGITKIEDLPEFETVKEKIQSFKESFEEEDKEN